MAARRKVLLVGWDAADWRVIQPLIDSGEMPVLGGIVEGGVSGNLASMVPMLSPMLWNSIATGKRPDKHGVHGFTEVDPELGQPAPVSSATRRCRALWHLLNQRGLRTHVVNWFATHPAEAIDGACVTDRFAAPTPAPGQPWPLPRGTVHPVSLAETLTGLRVRPEELDGDVLKLFVPRAMEVNQSRDKRLHHLAAHLAESFSVHAAATYLLEHEPWDFAAVYYRAIDWLSHYFMEFHPPKMFSRYAMEFELYKEVVTGVYRIHDAMLGRLLQLAGDDTTVLIVSDHGFHSDHLRPEATPDVPGGIAEWHRTSGVLAMRGAGLRVDELIHGAGLLDITPTVLALFGLPVGRDMDGRVLAEAFAEQPPPDTIPSWEPADAAAPAPAATVGKRSAEEEWSVVRQFVALGYLEDPGDDPREAIQSTRRENDWNLARSHLDAQRPVDALPLLEAVHAEWPERADYCFTLARCQLTMGLLDEAAETADSLLGAPHHTVTSLLRANIALHRGNRRACLDHLAAAEADSPGAPGLQVQIGRVHALLRQWAPAEAAFRRALESNPDEPRAHLGLAHCDLHNKRFEQAAQSALRSLGLRFDLPLGHFYLGIALAHLGETARAIQAFETSLRYQPQWVWPHRFLASLQMQLPGGEAQAHTHRERVRAYFANRAAALAHLEKLRRDSAARALDRATERTRRRAGQSPVVAPLALHAEEGPLAAPMDFVVVSGLPRSGTSLMMQMLAAGGLEPMRDDLRPADADNPRGYFEWQEIKGLPKNPRLIEKAQGHAVKVISMLLPYLPRTHRFRVIFMVRTLTEIVESQEQMRQRRQRRQGNAATASRPEMIAALEQHRQRTLEMLRESDNVEVLKVDFDTLFADPINSSARIATFAGLPTERTSAMAAVIAPEFRHHHVSE